MRESPMNPQDTEFPILCLSRTDLETLGFDTSDIDDRTMERLTEKLADDYCSNFLCDSLESICECLEISKRASGAEGK